MRAFALWMLLATALIGTSVGQNEGWNVIRNSTPPGGNTLSSAYVDVLPFYNALGLPPQDVCLAINNALLSVTATGLTSGAVTIDARGIPLYNPGGGGSPYLQCFTNPFAGNMAKGYTGKLLLGQGPIITKVQWNMPNQYFWVEGLGLSNSSSPALGSVIQASDGSKGVPAFACSNGVMGDYNTVTIPTIPGVPQCPVLFIAGSASASNYFDALGTGIRNLTVDCNTISHCVGVGSFDVQEGGGLDTVSFINQDTACVVLDSSGLPGHPAVSNPFIRNVDCGFSMPQTPPTKWIGLYIKTTDGPAEISNTTVAVPGIMNNTDPQFDYCLYLVGGRGVNVNYFHCEHAALAAEFLGSVTGASIRGLTASVTALGVQLMNSTDTSIHDVEMNNYSTTGLFPYVAPLMDGSTIVGGYTGGNTNFNLASYITSSTYPSAAASSKVNTAITTDSGTPSVFYKEQLIPVTGTTFLSTTPSAGTMMFCSDCAPSGAMGVCSSPGGPGTLAIYNGSHWLCR